MSTLSQVLIVLGIWGIVSLIISIPIANYIIDETNNEEYAFLVFPIWLILSVIGLGIYIS